LADTLASVRVLFALAERFPEVGVRDLERLHEDQIRWHHEWTADQEGTRLAQGMVQLDPRDYLWPVAPAMLPPAA
jgi:hypothetical protein